MSQPSTPRVKHSEVRRKPLIPGPNSWAQEAEKISVMKSSNPGIATNRSKYEDKPMPPLPPVREKSPPGPGKTGYIQPATPLTYSSPPSAKNRAVTDPAAAKNLLNAGKVSIVELRQKFSGSRAKTSTDLDMENRRSDTQDTTSNRPEPQTQPTGGRNINQNRRETPPSSAPANTNVPDPYRSPETAGRQTNSTPVPTRRYLRENNLPTPILTQASFSVPHFAYSDVDQVSEANKPEGIIIGDGRLNPTRTGAYGNIGEVEIVEGKGVHRVASFMGVIENAESLPSVSEQEQLPRSASMSPDRLNPVQGQTTLQPIAYSPSIYGGVWENDPHIGHTLLPFSPMTPRFHENLEQMQGAPQNHQQSLPMQDRAIYDQPSRIGDYPPPVQSANSWTQTHGRSDMHFQATVPPLFSNGPATNSVPPPPHTYRDYQPASRPVPPELHMLELNIHHHIDSCFGSLSRLVTDKIDQCSDQLLRQLENSETKSEKSLKVVKGDIKNIQSDIQALCDDVRGSQDYSERAENLIQESQSKLIEIGAKVDKVEDHLENRNAEAISSAERSENEEKTLTAMKQKLGEIAGRIDHLVEYIATDYEANGDLPHRSLSTSQRSPASHGQRQRFHSGTSYSSVGPRNSNTSSRGRRSYTATGGAVSGTSDGRNSQREYYAEIGNNMGAAPDLRQHPAFLPNQNNHGYDANGHPIGMASDGGVYQLPSFAGGGPNGWYQQAYGS